MPVMTVKPAATLSRVPPWLRHTISSRGEWRHCALERSRFGPMHDPTPAVPFHHLAVRLDRSPMRMGWTLDGRNLRTDLPGDHVSVIPAGASVLSWWNRPVDFACLYFSPHAIEAALGDELPDHARWELQPALAMQAPGICALLRALAEDTDKGQPYGKMRGEALFQQLVAMLVADTRILKDTQYRAGIGDRRVRRALEYIHENICCELSLDQIASAAETSPFHLTRIFRLATGQPVWRYVSGLRVQLATGLMKDPALTLIQVARLSGFASYSTFAAMFRAERGVSPSRYRQTGMPSS